MPEDSPVATGTVPYGEPLEPHVLDLPSSTWVPTAGPQLPAGSVPQFGESISSATLYSVEPVYVPEPFESSASLEIDGYTYTQTITESSEAYQLTDTATGEVVVAESFRYDEAFSGRDGPYEHFRHRPFGGFTITDPESGDILVEVDDADLQPFYEELYSFEREEPSFVDGPAFSEMRVLATNGESWIDAPLEMSYETQRAPVPATTVVVDGDGDAPVEAPAAEMVEEWVEPAAWPNSVAANDEVVIVAMSDGTYQRFEF